MDCISYINDLIIEIDILKKLDNNNPEIINKINEKEDNINVSNGYGRGDNYRRNSACITKSRNSKNICWNRSKINCICIVLGR